MNKYIKVFSKERADQLLESGFAFLFEKNQIYWFENDEKIVKFSDSEILKDTKTTNVINF